MLSSVVTPAQAQHAAATIGSIFHLVVASR